MWGEGSPIPPPGSNYYDLIMNITKEYFNDLGAPVSLATGSDISFVW